MAFPERWMAELLSRNEIVSVVSSYVSLKPKGRRLWGRCPIHGEKTPSFCVTPEKQLFYCFGCHAGGSVIQFIMDMEHLNFQESVRFLAERAGMQMPEEVDDAELQQKKAYRDRLQDACRQAARYYMECLLGPEGEPGRKYFARRGLNAEIVKRFGLGYAPDGWDHLKRHLTQAGFTEKELVDAGLLVFNERKQSTYDAYRNRVIYPIIGISGKVIGFGARTIGDDNPKYINTGDTEIYNKRKNLYGLYLVKNEKLSDLVMVEGYMDVIGLYQAGIHNAVASLGTALTEQQARLLKRYVETVYIAYDGDAPGQNAMIRGLDILAAEGLNVRVIVFPDDLDPDEFVRQKGKEAFDRLKEDALTLNAYKLEWMARRFDLNKENEREKYAMEACRFIAGLQPVEQDRYYLQVSRKTGYSPEVLKNQGGKSTPLQEPSPRRTETWKHRQAAENPETNDRIQAEETVLYAVLNSRNAASEYVRLDRRELLSPSCAEIAEFAVAAWKNGTAPDAAELLSRMSSDQAKLLSGALKEDYPLKEPEQTVQDCLRRIRKYDLSEEIEKMTDSLKDPALSETEKMDRLRQIQKLEQEKRKI